MDSLGPRPTQPQDEAKSLEPKTLPEARAGVAVDREASQALSASSFNSSGIIALRCAEREATGD